MKKKIIQYIDAAIGTGKSYQLVSTILQGREISSVPSKSEAESRFQLIKELRPDLNPIKIDSDDKHDNGTLQRVIQAMEQSGHNDIIICCHHTSFRIDNQYFYDNHYRLIVDDPESLYKDVGLQFDEVKHKFKSLFNVDDYGDVTLKTKTSVYYTAPNKQIKEVMADIHSGKWQYFYCTSRDFSENTKVDETSHELLRIPSLELFPDNTLLIGEDVANNFYFKIYHDLLNIVKLDIESHRTFEERNIYLYYFTGQRNTIGSKISNREITGKRYERCLSIMDGSPSLILKNESDTISATNLTKIPINCQSMNMYQNFNNIIVTFCGNLSPWSYTALGKFGIDSDDVYRDRTINVIHQAIGRTSYRDANSSTDIKVVVFDEYTAEQLKHRIVEGHPNFNVKLLPIKGYEILDRRKTKTSKYNSKAEGKKVRNIVALAKKGQYPSKINERVLLLDRTGRREKIAKETFFKYLNNSGTIQKSRRKHYEK